MRGGADRSFERPCFIHLVTPLPLHCAETQTGQILRPVACGVPLDVGTFDLGGAALGEHPEGGAQLAPRMAEEVHRSAPHRAARQRAAGVASQERS